MVVLKAALLEVCLADERVVPKAALLAAKMVDKKAASLVLLVVE